MRKIIFLLIAAFCVSCCETTKIEFGKITETDFRNDTAIIYAEKGYLTIDDRFEHPNPDFIKINDPVIITEDGCGTRRVFIAGKKYHPITYTLDDQYKKVETAPAPSNETYTN